MQAENMETMNTTDREIIQTRVFNAPRDLVFKAWTDPKHIDRWFGPRGFTTQTSEMDFRPGGVWRFVMRHAQYGTYTNKVVFLEFVKPERLVYDHGADDSNPPHFRVTVTFTERGQKTELGPWDCAALVKPRSGSNSPKCATRAPRRSPSR